MPRRARLKMAGLPWHVWQRGVNRSRCFSGIADRKLYLELLAKFAAVHDCRVHAYVLMPNHVHLLVSPGSDGAASKMMKAIGERYVRAFNKRHKRTGTLWEGRFKSTVVDTEQYLFTLYRYIELNPVRAGMVRHPSEYPWSSYAVNAEGAASDLVTPHRLFLAMGEDEEGRRRRYRESFDSLLTDRELTDIRDALSGGFALGGAIHHGAVESHTGMRSQRQRRRNGEGAAKSVPV
jgi:putative transposase